LAYLERQFDDIMAMESRIRRDPRYVSFHVVCSIK
jgi:septin family protein